MVLFRVSKAQPTEVEKGVRVEPGNTANLGTPSKLISKAYISPSASRGRAAWGQPGSSHTADRPARAELGVCGSFCDKSALSQRGACVLGVFALWAFGSNPDTLGDWCLVHTKPS